MTKNKWKLMSEVKRVKWLTDDCGMDKKEALEIVSDYKDLPDEIKTYIKDGGCPKCGCDSFSAHQRCYHTVFVDGRNKFDEDVEIYDSDTPYGPYTCQECGAETYELPEG